MTAAQTTTYNQLPSISRRRLDKVPLMIETRNIICAHMKRNDPVSRRFIQYILMQRGEALILVRDGKTGKVIVGPEEDERWLVRAIPGLMAPLPGYNTPTPPPWRTMSEVGSAFFTTAEASRKWHFNFDAYYEIYMWDFAPGEDGDSLYRLIMDALLKARRMKGLRDKYRHQQHITSVLTRDKTTKGVRPIRPGEKAQSLHEELTSPKASYWVRTKYGETIQTTADIPPGYSANTFYNDADAAEDAVLFEEGLPDNCPFIEITNPMQMFETGRLPPSIMYYQANLLKKTLFPDKAIDDAASQDSDPDWESDYSEEGYLGLTLSHRAAPSWSTRSLHPLRLDG
ncbi:hypothetical protein GE09DRAFT_192340 [Coniochaeta sp. 2T2.1]|nr:hypothetical protein GE09DRAFT_192340 [Coniochaeta sp. 2T2.1]